jgi:methionine synthase I (cobalamin-dependent)
VTPCRTSDQAQALAEAGVDVLVIETQFDPNDAAAIAARQVTHLPLVCSFSFDWHTTMMGVKPSQMSDELRSLT